MKLTLQNTLIAASSVLILLAALIVLSAPYKAGATDATVIPAKVATTSPAAVSATASTVFATSTCTSRVISTQAVPIMVTYSDNQGRTPSATLGHFQAASTTVVYDAGLYGCDAFKVYSFGAQTITVTEAR